MELSFELEGQQVLYVRNAATGRATLRVGDDLVTVESPYRPSTHMQLRTRHVRRVQVLGHDVAVIKTRPRMFGGLRENNYQITVDGRTVAQASGQ